MQLRNNPLDLDMDLDLRAGRSVSDCLFVCLEIRWPDMAKILGGGLGCVKLASCE